MEFNLVQNQESFEEINLLEICKLLWEKKLRIFLTTIFFSIISFSSSLFITDLYKSSSLVAVLESQNSSGLSSITSEFGGLAAIAGISLPSSGEKNKSSLAIETIKSRKFFRHIVTKYDLLPKILKSDSDVAKISKMGPNYLKAHNIFLKELLEISEDNKTKYLLISISHQSPEFAESLLSIIIKEVNAITKEFDLNESSRALDYLNNLLPVTQVEGIKKSINSLIENQLETQMLASIQDDYILRVLDPPFIPESINSPNRIIYILLGGIIGFILSVMSLFLTNINNSKKPDSSISFNEKDSRYK